MQSPIDTIISYGIPTTSYIEAAQYVMNDDPENGRPFFGLWSQERYETGIQSIIGLTAIPKYINLKTARLVFGYTVQETIKTFNSGIIPSMEDVWTDVTTKSAEYIKNHPWSVKDYTQADGEPKLDAAGNPKQKKGAKKELAREVWNENKHKEMSRKEWIALLVELVGLTPAGASTYYAGLKKNTL
jgi:hypothetical protein